MLLLECPVEGVLVWLDFWDYIDKPEDRADLSGMGLLEGPGCSPHVTQKAAVALAPDSPYILQVESYMTWVQAELKAVQALKARGVPGGAYKDFGRGHKTTPKKKYVHP